MAHGLNTVLRRPTPVGCKTEGKGSGIGSRRIFAPHFKLQVLDSYRNDSDCKGNQRATARKYGIHRRQIQKWLQCENNLRNSVGKAKAVSLEARKCGPEVSLRSGQLRQQDDFCSEAYSQVLPEQSIMCMDGSSSSSSIQSPPMHDVVCFQEEVRIPSINSNHHESSLFINTPLDYTMHCRSRSTSPVEVGAPIDLSFKRTSSNEIISPVYCNFTIPEASLRIPSPSHSNNTPQNESNIWDLSTKHQNKSLEMRNNNNHSPAPESQSKPVKLFKPYLDDLDRKSMENKPKVAEIPPFSTESVVSPTEYNLQFYNNNYITADYTAYSLLDLQPKNTISYYHTIDKNCIYTPQCEKAPCCSPYDNSVYLQHSPPIKHGQFYSLDVKVSAIESYYPDSVGHGINNEHAMMTKFNIRDPFPKLHHIQDIPKFTHVVR